MEWGRRLAGIILLAVLTISLSNQTLHAYISVPKEMTLFESDWESEDNERIIQEKLNLLDQEKVEIKEDATTQEATVKVASFPEKKTKINTIPDIKVIPGGDSIGVKLQSDGVMIVGFHELKEENERISPAKKAGLKSGDRIVEIDGHEIKRLEDVVEVLKETKDKSRLQVKIKRGNEQKKVTVHPHQGEDGNVIGAYIRNAASGVGTLTFYEAKSGKFGALGHVIADSDTKKPVVVKDGEIVRSSVKSIERGANGSPGEKQAVLSTSNEVLGKVTKNSSFGVFGQLEEDKLLKKSFYSDPLPIAFAHEVKKGPAEILTVVEDEKVEKFDIEIVQSVPQVQAASKGMVIKVTDEKLLEKTGGIIQGMSGSPIIQDGKIVGAVTHVFVNDSTSGYATHIEWMLEEAGIDTFYRDRRKAS